MVTTANRLWLTPLLTHVVYFVCAYTTLSCSHMQQQMVIPYITPVMEIEQVSKTLVCNRTLMWLISWETFSTRGSRFALGNLMKDIPLCYELKTLKQSVIFASNTTKFYSSMTTYVLTYGFGGLVVSMLASGTRVHGFKPDRSHWIFQASEKSSACLPSEGKWKNLSHVPALRHAKEPSTSVNYDVLAKFLV